MIIVYKTAQLEKLCNDECIAVRRLGTRCMINIFHEMAHVILHEQRMFFEGGHEGECALEDEADKYARNLLIPESYAMRLRDAAESAVQVKALAIELGIAPGIIVGRLQHDKLIRWSQMNELKVCYNWKDLRV